MLYSIHALRFLAASAVVMHHAELFPGFGLGQAGVDLFFVISGVVIGTSGPGMAPSAFLLRRFVRIFPLYWAATAAMLAWRQYNGAPTPLSDIIHSLLLVPPNLSSASGWAPIYIPAWTLSFELMFYVTFAACLTLTLRPRLVSAIVLVAGAFALWDPTSTNYVRYGAILMLEFIAGLAIAVALSRNLVPSRPLGAGLIVLSLIGFGLSTTAHTAHREVIWGVPATLMVYGILAFEPARLFSHPFVVLGGSASYAIYLFHVHFIFLFRASFGGVTAANRPLFALFEIAGSVIVGMAVYKLLDKPMLGFMHRKLAAAWLPRGKGAITLGS
jgi:exopolysaccharide production protein ExoZ